MGGGREGGRNGSLGHEEDEISRQHDGCAKFIVSLPLFPFSGSMAESSEADEVGSGTKEEGRENSTEVDGNDRKSPKKDTKDVTSTYVLHEANLTGHLRYLLLLYYVIMFLGQLR